MDAQPDNRSEAATVLSDSTLRQLVDRLVDGVLVLNRRGVVVYGNRQADAIFGFPQNSSRLPMSSESPTPCVRLVDVIEPDDARSQVASVLDGLMQQPRASDTPDDWIRLEIQTVRGDGTIFWVDLRFGRIAIENHVWIVAVVRDIDHQKRDALALVRAATTDELSGLANRRAFQHALEQHADQPIVIAFVDVDHFKAINDQYGHFQGDQAIRFVADHLVKTFPDAICVARLGGDEFGVIFRLDPDVRSVVDRLDELRNRIATIPFRGDGATLTFSVGVAASQPDAHWPRALLTRADRALYQAKTKGRNRTCTWGNGFEPGHSDESQDDRAGFPDSDS